MPSEKDRFDGDHCFICVHQTGLRFHLYKDTPGEIDINHIANSLSKQVRWTGHLKGDSWYSTAEHSMLVAKIVKLLGGSKYDQFTALMHDATEAYLADIAAPFKRELGGYYEKEALIWKRLVAAFGLPEQLPELVKTADWIALWIEARFLVVDNVDICRSWVGWDQFGETAMLLVDKYPELIPDELPHYEARVQFLDTLKEINR